MLTFSLKTLLAFVSLAGVASYLMVHPTVSVAIVIMLLAALSLITITAIGLWNRRPAAVVVAGACCCYLLIADGGLFPGLERFLPTERLLSQGSKYHTVFDSGRKRADSLTVWAGRLCLEPNHKDHLALISNERPQPTDLNSVPTPFPINYQTSVELPSLALTSVTTIKTVSKRDDPQNRPYFIVGHCLFVLSIVLLAFLVVQARRDAKQPAHEMLT